jgi:hypothetical protein
MGGAPSLHLDPQKQFKTPCVSASISAVHEEWLDESVLVDDDDEDPCLVKKFLRARDRPFSRTVQPGQGRSDGFDEEVLLAGELDARL